MEKFEKEVLGEEVKFDIVMVDINDIVPYDKNPRNNDRAVDVVVKSIEEFGMKQPLVLDKNNIIVVGHTRRLALERLGVKKVPCIYANDLTDEQIKAYRIMDNKSNEFAVWDMDILNIELDELKAIDFDISLTGFDMSEVGKLDTVNSADDEWVGMPEFDTKDASHKIIFHFESEAARKEFDEKFGFKYLKKESKTWSTWWPYKDRDDLVSLKYEEGE
jgi:hypothetical protein